MPLYRRVFMSHAHRDNIICKQYADALRARGIDVWLDLTNLQGGRDLGEEIARELRERTAFILMVTPTSNESYWVRQERGVYNILVNTPETHYVNGVERMILPVRLGDVVPTQFINLLWFEAENRPVTEVVERIVAALEIIPNYNASFSNQPTPPLPHEDPEAPPHLPELDVETETLYMQARSAFALKDWETAIAFFQQVVYRDPNYDYGAARADLEIARQRLIPVRIGRWHDRADAAARAGRWVEEIYYWNLILNLDVNHVYAPDENERLQVAEQNQRAESKYQRAKNFLAQNKLKAAQSEIQRLIADAPHFGDPDGVGEKLGMQLPLSYPDYQIQQHELAAIDRDLQEIEADVAKAQEELNSDSASSDQCLAACGTLVLAMILLVSIPCAIGGVLALIEFGLFAILPRNLQSYLSDGSNNLSTVGVVVGVLDVLIGLAVAIICIALLVRLVYRIVNSTRARLSMLESRRDSLAQQRNSLNGS